MIADSGSYGHYLNPGDAKYLTRVEEDASVTVTLPNDMQMTSSLSGDLNIDSIPQEARKAHIFKELTSWSLLSLGVLCDAGCTATLSSDKLTVNLFDKVVLNGYRNHTTSGMWMVDLTNEIPTAIAARHIEPINNVYPTGTIAKLVAFYHGCACSVPIPSFHKILEPRDNKKRYSQISTNHGGDSCWTPRWNKIRQVPAKLQALVVHTNGLRG